VDRVLPALLFLAATPGLADQPDATLLARARSILQRAPLLDTHNDLTPCSTRSA
jgi:hypothetical protein